MIFYLKKKKHILIIGFNKNTGKKNKTKYE